MQLRFTDLMIVAFRFQYKKDMFSFSSYQIWSKAKNQNISHHNFGTSDLFVLKNLVIL